MGIAYILVNQSKQETIFFDKLPVATMGEISGNPVSASIVTWYLFQNQEDNIQFVSDTYDEWPFQDGSRDDLVKYVDKTADIINELIEQKILVDEGILYRDEHDPSIYLRKLKNIF